MTDLKLLQKGLEHHIPLKIEKEVDLRGRKVTLAIVDEIDGFCKPGAGALAPPASDAEIDNMINRTDELARECVKKGITVIALTDCHEGPEPPYPDHCLKGSGEERLVDKLKWLEEVTANGDAMIMRKNCINGFIGAIRADNSNAIVDIVDYDGIEAMIVDGICTDICVLQFVQAMLSARNHGMMPTLKDIVVRVNACATYDLPRSVAETIGLPIYAAHPRELLQHIGLYLMQMSGAILAEKVIID